MATKPTLHIIAGPNGAGKSTFREKILTEPLEFVNADIIAAAKWPGQESERAYDAAALAATRRDELIESRRSFITETVFSHESKIELLRKAADLGYFVHLHVIMVPENLSVERVAVRVECGGHDVPEDKIRSRHQRLWRNIAEAIADLVEIYGNTLASAPFVPVAVFSAGRRNGWFSWPLWTPNDLADL